MNFVAWLNIIQKPHAVCCDGNGDPSGGGGLLHITETRVNAKA